MAEGPAGQAGEPARPMDAAALGDGPVAAGLRVPLAAEDLDDLRFGPDGLIPVIAQDRPSGAVLMLAWGDRQSLEQSLASGRMTYWSRGRQELWEKGVTSGHTQRLVSLHADCDQDAVLAVVEQEGPACHTGAGTCWADSVGRPVAGVLGELDRLMAKRQAAPQGRYTDSLLADPAAAATKVEEEAAELSRVVRGLDNDDPLEHEAADLLFHMLVAVRAAGGELDSVLDELRTRRG